jgi:hypothetical protein
LGCTSLTHVSIPNTVKTIGLRAFEECSALENISIPESVIEIGGYAFYNCTGIKTLILPDTLIYVEEGIFKGWTPEQTIFIERVTPSYSWTYYLVTDAKIYWGNEWEYVDGVPVPQE